MTDVVSVRCPCPRSTKSPEEALCPLSLHPEDECVPSLSGTRPLHDKPKAGDTQEQASCTQALPGSSPRHSQEAGIAPSSLAARTERRTAPDGPSGGARAGSRRWSPHASRGPSCWAAASPCSLALPTSRARGRRCHLFGMRPADGAARCPSSGRKQDRSLLKIHLRPLGTPQGLATNTAFPEG